MQRALLVTIIAVHPLLSATLHSAQQRFRRLRVLRDGARGDRVAPVLACGRRRADALFLEGNGRADLFAALGLHVLFRLLETSGAPAARLKPVVRSTWPASLPLALFAAFLALVGRDAGFVRDMEPGHPRASGRGDALVRLRRRDPAQLRRDHFRPRLRLDSGDGDTRRRRRSAPTRAARTLGDRPLPGVDAKLAGYLAALTALLVYLLTVYRTWSFPRYFVVLAPLLILAGAHLARPARCGMRRAPHRARRDGRRAVLGEPQLVGSRLAFRCSAHSRWARRPCTTCPASRTISASGTPTICATISSSPAFTGR